MPKKTTSEFIEEARKNHGNKYDYSKVEYINNRTKVEIICPIHGSFFQFPYDHKSGRGCPYCSKIKKRTKEEFIKEAKKVHGDFYDYSKVEYKNASSKVKIICPIHGEFSQEAQSHLKGHGCMKCRNTRKYNTEKFIEKAREIHGNFYDYSKTNYETSHDKVIITCPKHGDFQIYAYSHIQGFGCQTCSSISNKSSAEKEIEKILQEKNLTYSFNKDFGIGLPFDFYVFDYNLVIEFDGIQHFEEVEFFGGKDFLERTRINDEIKNSFCRENNINIIRIPYWKKNEIREIIEETVESNIMNTKDFIEKAKEVHGNKYDYSKVQYLDTHTKVKIICPIHGEFEQQPRKHIGNRKSGCPQCAKEETIKRNKKRGYTREEFIQKAKEIHGNEYDYSQMNFIDATKYKLKITCPIHGPFYKLGKDHLNGQGCPKCAEEGRVEKRRLPKEEFLKRAKEIHGDFYDYSKVEYKRENDYVKIICPVHGMFKQRVVNHLQGYGCNKCAVDSRKSNKPIGTEEFIRRAKEIHGDKYYYSNTKYSTSHEYVNISCPIHGEWSTLAYINLQGRGCPNCRNSNAQNEIFDFIQSLGLSPISNTRSVISPYEIDIFIPEKNIGIEYHGLYWHSEQQLAKTKDKPRRYHLEKLEKAEENGIRLIQIFENEWLEKKEIVKHRLLFILGLSEKIGARKTIVKEISSKEGRDFLERYHIQGAGRAKYYFGLFYDKRLVSVMSFSSLRAALGSSSKEGVFELNRFASSYQIIGGASKLLEYFIRNYNPKETVSYSDRRWNTGNVYKQLGFEFIHNTQPNYWYITENGLFHRYNFRKDVLKKKLPYYDENLTEYENMLANGYDRIWDCGNKKFVLFK